MSFNLGEAVLHLIGDGSKLQTDTAATKTKVENILGKVGTGMKAVGVGMVATVGAVTAITAALGTTISPASDLNETVSKVGVVFGASADQVLRFGENSDKALGMSKNAALSAAGTYGNLFRALGLAENQSAEMSTTLVGLAGDLASFNNVDPTIALDSLRAGLTGETEPLKKFGININEALLKQKAMELGLYSGTGAIEASAKAQASYALILEQTSLAQGDFARTSEGAANQERIWAASQENIKAAIGTGLLPIIQKAYGALNNYAGQISSLISDGTMTMQEKIVKGGEIVKNIATDISNNLPQMMDTGIGILKALITGLITALPSLMPAIVEVVMSILQFLIEVLPILVEGALQIVLALATGIGQALPELIPAIVEMLLMLVQILIENLPLLVDAGLQIVVGLIQGLIAAIPMLIDAIPQLIESIVMAIMQALPMIIQAAIQIIVALISGLIQAIPQLVAAIPQILIAINNGLKSGLSNLKGIGAELMDSFGAGLKSKFDGIWQSVTNFARGIVEKVRGALDLHSPSPLAIGIATQWMDSLSTGLGMRMDMVGAMAGSAGSRIAGNTISGLNNARSNGGNISRSTQIIVNNPVAETTEKSIKSNMQKISYLGVLDE